MSAALAAMKLTDSNEADDMKPRIKSRSLVLVGIGAVILFLATASVCQAQPETPKQRLRSPATVRNFIGGESQDHYVIRARKGQRLTVAFSWRKEQDNTASFSVSADSDGAESLTGKESNDGKRWTARIPRTGDYLISVMAHPSARYKLSVVLK
jgi:hypothetical protein